MRIAALSIATLLLLLSFAIPANTVASVITMSEPLGVESEIDTIPIPGENHSVVPIEHVVCASEVCHLENLLDGDPIEWFTSWSTSFHDVVYWSGSFNTSEDHDAVLLNPLRNDSHISPTYPSEQDLTYEICIDITEVPMKLEAWQRDDTTLLQLGELTANTPLTVNSTSEACMGFIYPASNYTELWLETSSLSTAGNYTLVFSAVEIGENPVTPLLIHDLSIGGTEYSSSYITSGNSLDGNHSVLYHPTDRDHLWNLKSVADLNHSVRLDCILADGTKYECARYESTLNEDGLHSIGLEENLHLAPEGVIAFEVILELEGPAMWAIEHDLVHAYSDPIMWYFEVEPYVDELSMTRFPGGDAPGNLTELQCDMEAIHHLGCRYFPDNDSGRNGRTGYLPLATLDEADVYAMDIRPVSEDLTFILEVQIQAEPGSVMLELHTVDWNGSITVTSLTPMSGEVETLRLEVISGVHDLRVINVRIGDSQNWSYGDLDQPIIEYWLRVDWILNYSAVEDDLTPSAELLFWDSVLLWAWGICFLLPLAWVLFNIRRERQRLQILLHDRARLARLRHLTNPEEAGEARRDLTMFISALTKVDWEILLSTWGEPDISHLTSDAQLHMWRLDSALAEHSAGIPLLVMVEVAKADWDIAALRFEAPQGATWNVVKVLPSLLSRGHEIFLDDLKVGNRIFVNVELAGDAAHIALHLSGVQSGVPVAAKPPQSLIIDTSEEE